MEIKTKFNINDEVWFVHPISKRAVQGRVMQIEIHAQGKHKYRRSDNGKLGLVKTGEYESSYFLIQYCIDDNVRKEPCTLPEYQVHETKEQLLERISATIEPLVGIKESGKTLNAPERYHS